MQATAHAPGVLDVGAALKVSLSLRQTFLLLASLAVRHTAPDNGYGYFPAHRFSGQCAQLYTRQCANSWKYENRQFFQIKQNVKMGM